jgi:predicted ATPase
LIDQPDSQRSSRTRGASFGVTRGEVSGFWRARKVEFSPGPICALVGEAKAGKSNLLAAIRAVLDPSGAALTVADVTHGGSGQVSIELRLADGSTAALEGRPGQEAISLGKDPPPILFLAAEERGGPARAVQATGRSAPATGFFESAFVRQTPTPAAQALAIMEALESCNSQRLGGLLLLIEEPELYLRPQAQRYLYRLLREFTLAGNHVIYSTHSPAFLNFPLTRRSRPLRSVALK